MRLHAFVNLDYLLTQLSTMFLCQMHISATLTLQWIVTKYLLTILQLTVTTHGHLPVTCISDELYSCSDPVCKSHFSVLQSLCLQLLLSTEESAHLHVHLPKTNVFFLVGILMHTLFVRLLHSGTRLVWVSVHLWGTVSDRLREYEVHRLKPQENYVKCEMLDLASSKSLFKNCTKYL